MNDLNQRLLKLKKINTPLYNKCFGYAGFGSVAFETSMMPELIKTGLFKSKDAKHLEYKSDNRLNFIDAENCSLVIDCVDYIRRRNSALRDLVHLMSDKEYKEVFGTDRVPITTTH